MISAIVAVDVNWGIGFDGELLERIPEDLKHFKELTSDNTVVMGRKTWDSLPKKPLPNRFNIIISRIERPYEINSFTWFTSLESCIKTMLNDDIDDYFIIGGGQIYEELLPYCDRVYVTKIPKAYPNVDTYFPVDLDESSEWRQVETGEMREYNNIAYHFLTYERV